MSLEDYKIVEPPVGTDINVGTPTWEGSTTNERIPQKLKIVKLDEICEDRRR